MVTVALILALAVLAALLLATWQTLRDRTRALFEANLRANRMTARAEAYLRMLRDAGLCEAVDTCQRTRGGQS